MNRKLALAAGVAAVLSGLVIPSAPASAGSLQCNSGRAPEDGYVGRADCHNPTGQTWVYRAVITCGWSPDVVGPWVTLGPGASGRSEGKCASWGSGVGAVGVDERQA
ncbi:MULTISPECIES: hypothetical protein [unclassified Nonomuraea]|uniref:hypothetical protein n=1 Tax=unclassified Nonomuraea TaxID=2593643 RepID=UPI0033301966